MSNCALLEKMSKENVFTILDTYKISMKEAKKLTALSLDATLFNGHINLKDFRSLERLYVFKPFNKESKILIGITSLDLSGNKAFKEVYFGEDTVPNFDSITLSHSNQIETFCSDKNIHALNVFADGKKEAFCRNMVNRIGVETDKKLKHLLEQILSNYFHVSKFKDPEDIDYQKFLNWRLLKEFGQNQFA